MAQSGTQTPTVTLFCGLPGAGKSTLARQLEAAGQGVRLSTDEWQAALGVEHANTHLHERLQSVLWRHACDLLRAGVDVLVEDGLWRRSERTDAFAAVRACGARIELHVFDVAFETLWSRLQRRARGTDPAAYPMTLGELRRAWELFELPTADELTDVDRVLWHGEGVP